MESGGLSKAFRKVFDRERDHALGLARVGSGRRDLSNRKETDLPMDRRLLLQVLQKEHHGHFANLIIPNSRHPE
jgi:hypothetical protein